MGLRLDHVNAHKHFHLHPTIASTVIRVGRSFGLHSARVPYEPARILADIDRKAARAPTAIMAPWSILLRRRFRADHIATPDRIFGLRWSGAMTQTRLLGLLRRLPERGSARSTSTPPPALIPAPRRAIAMPRSWPL